MDYYSTQHLATMFNVSTTAIKNWAVEFVGYLSPTATPETGKKRRFTSEDARVLALVNQYRLNGYQWEDVHMALRAGQRGEIPAPDDLALAEPPPALLQSLKEEIMRKNAEIEQARQQVIEADKRTADALGQIKVYSAVLAEKERQIQELYEKLADLKAQIKH